MNMANLNMTEAWKVLIKPDRVGYSIDNLGPKHNCFSTNDCYRKDFSFRNNRGNNIYYSLIFPLKRNQKVENHEELLLNCPCVIYCHSQSGNKLEGMFL